MIDGKYKRLTVGARLFTSPTEPRHDLVCEVCKESFSANRRRKFCSEKCKGRKRTLDKNPQAKLKAVTGIKPDANCVCRKCGIDYVNKRRDGSGGKYCSRACAYADIQNWLSPERGIEKAAPFSAVYFKTCTECGESWTSKHDRGIYCSVKCRLENYKSKKHSDCKSKVCSVCGGEFTPNHHLETACSKGCIQNRKRQQKKATGSKTHRKRARKHGAVYQPVNVLRVMERDGWICQICGKPTPKDRRGKRYSNSPELDHRIPFALGGSHTYDNVQCACRSCNNIKGGTKIVGQIGLF